MHQTHTDSAYITELEQQIEAERRWRKRAEEALEPFASLWSDSFRSRVGGDSAPVWQMDEHKITVGDIRRACALLADQPQEG